LRKSGSLENVPAALTVIKKGRVKGKGEAAEHS